MAKTVGEPIAIIGSACHFAGEASSPSKLWTLLQNPHDVRREVPNSRFSARGFYHKRHTQPGHSNVRHGYLMNEDLSGFDAEFFGIKPLEAKAIDPQQRWLMESVYEVRGYLHDPNIGNLNEIANRIWVIRGWSRLVLRSRR